MVEPNKMYRRFIHDLEQGSVILQTNNSLGYSVIPGPVDISHLNKKITLPRFFKPALPAAYDLRNQGRVSTVKDQGPAGTCWTFAALSSLESCLLPAEKWDFSENNMKNLLSGKCPEGFDRNPDEGGNQFMATAYLARWSGPLTEKEDPYDPVQKGTCLTLKPHKHLQEVIYIPDRRNASDNTQIKESIINYGALFTTMYYDDAKFDRKNNSYYYKGNNYANHAVCIVGWDDNYDRRKFVSTPKGKGAFIVKNSWGEAWGDKGYFYVSYYDSRIGQNNASFSGARPTSQYTHIHQYDSWGWVSSVGFADTTGWFANVFKAQAAQELKAVSWYTASPKAPYLLYVYTNVTSEKPRSGTLAKKISGTVDLPGYHTFEFKKPLFLAAGKSFSVVVKLTTPKFKYPIPIQMPIPNYSSKAKGKPHQGYISPDGQTWLDIADNWENTSICLKAFAL